jgi:catechol 2,3-dioxygenase-like lactoylglutathione lyase family enzyme
MITGISAVTLATHDMARALRFYRIVGCTVIHGGEDAPFTSLRLGEDNFLNLIAQPAGRQWSWWGRLIIYESDVDALHARLSAAGLPARCRAARCGMG